MTTTIVPQLQATQQAAAQVRRLTSEQKTALINRLADLLIENQTHIKAENQKDMELMADNDPKKDRLFLNEKRIQGLADSLRDVAQLPDPSGQVVFEREIEQGLQLKKIAVPLGVVGAIFE